MIYSVALLALLAVGQASGGSTGQHTGRHLYRFRGECRRRGTGCRRRLMRRRLTDSNIVAWAAAAAAGIAGWFWWKSSSETNARQSREHDVEAFLTKHVFLSSDRRYNRQVYPGWLSSDRLESTKGQLHWSTVFWEAADVWKRDVLNARCFKGPEKPNPLVLELPVLLTWASAWKSMKQKACALPRRLRGSRGKSDVEEEFEILEDEEAEAWESVVNDTYLFGKLLDLQQKYDFLARAMAEFASTHGRYRRDSRKLRSVLEDFYIKLRSGPPARIKSLGICGCVRNVLASGLAVCTVSVLPLPDYLRFLFGPKWLQPVLLMMVVFLVIKKCCCERLSCPNGRLRVS